MGFLYHVLLLWGTELPQAQSNGANVSWMETCKTVSQEAFSSIRRKADLSQLFVRVTERGVTNQGPFHKNYINSF